MEDKEAVRTFDSTWFLHILLFSFDWIWARYNGVGIHFTTFQGRQSFPMHRMDGNVAIERTHQLWDIWDYSIACAG
jgi:hypothetical protein